MALGKPQPRSGTCPAPRTKWNAARSKRPRARHDFSIGQAGCNLRYSIAVWRNRPAADRPGGRRSAKNSPESVTAAGLPGDGMSGTIRFRDGSVGTFVYAVTGDPASGKERFEVFGGGVSAVLENYRKLMVSRGGRYRKVRAAGGKGHREELRAFLDAVRSGGPSPVPFEEAVRSTRVTLALVAAATSGRSVDPGGA